MGAQKLNFEELHHHQNIFKALQRGEKGIFKQIVNMNSKLSGDCQFN